MKLLLIAIPITSALIAAAAFEAMPGGTATPGTRSNGARVPVVLELFTSEGCSSCPPADKLLQSLDGQSVGNADLIVLSEHVDYWNYLGWRDPYSSPFFSARQQKYAERLRSEVYTPQLVVDGDLQALGSDRREVLEAIAKAAGSAKLPISVRADRTGRTGTLHVEANSGGTNADLYIVIAADQARSQVLRGENGGHVLTHVAVAQSITRVGKWEGATNAARDVPLAGAKSGESRIVAFLQDPRTGRILGAAQTRL